MKNILGLDLGTHSIGWAIIDQDSNKVLNCRTTIFTLVKRRHQSTRSSYVFSFFKKRSLAILWIYFCFCNIALIIDFKNWQFWLNLIMTLFLSVISMIDNKSFKKHDKL